MPQLRDSGNHSTAPLDAHTKDESNPSPVFSASKPNTV